MGKSSAIARIWGKEEQKGVERHRGKRKDGDKDMKGIGEGTVSMLKRGRKEGRGK